MQRTIINNEELVKDYVEHELSTYDCAKKYSIAASAVRERLIKSGIVLRQRNQYTTKRLEKLKNSEKIGSKTKSYYDNIRETGIVPENEILRRQKIGFWSHSFNRTDEHKEKIGKALIGNTNSLGRVVSDETRQKISESNKKAWRENPNQGMTGRTHTDETKAKISTSHLKENLSDEALRAYRESAIIRIERQIADGLPVTPSIGKNEKEIIDKYEKMLGCTFERQYRVAGFFVDGYCKEKNLVIEVDEDYHKKREELDIYRELIIKKELGCDIIRVEAHNI